MIGRRRTRRSTRRRSRVRSATASRRRAGRAGAPEVAVRARVVATDCHRSPRTRASRRGRPAAARPDAAGRPRVPRGRRGRRRPRPTPRPRAGPLPPTGRPPAGRHMPEGRRADTDGRRARVPTGGRTTVPTRNGHPARRACPGGRRRPGPRRSGRRVRDPGETPGPCGRPQCDGHRHRHRERRQPAHVTAPATRRPTPTGRWRQGRPPRPGRAIRSEWPPAAPAPGDPPSRRSPPRAPAVRTGPSPRLGPGCTTRRLVGDLGPVQQCHRHSFEGSGQVAAVRLAESGRRHEELHLLDGGSDPSTASAAGRAGPAPRGQGLVDRHPPLDRLGRTTEPVGHRAPGVGGGSGQGLGQ